MSGVSADSGKTLHLLDRSREMSTMSIRHELRGDVQISSSSVVAQALPGMKDIVLFGRSERGKARETPQPVFVIADNRRDLGLLKHEFGNQDAVWIARLTPREVAAMTAIPIHEGAAKLIFPKSHS